ncbi:MAG TPA: hypothetical protein QGH10_25830 [Armatimonadota bacterium]|jgi:hypothetical protein|nr:hypothetical protein [Armatimonadota bacterium]
MRTWVMGSMAMMGLMWLSALPAGAECCCCASQKQALKKVTYRGTGMAARLNTLPRFSYKTYARTRMGLRNSKYSYRGPKPQPPTPVHCPTHHHGHGQARAGGACRMCMGRH